MDLVLGERRKLGQKKNQLTWVATYTREAGVTQVIHGCVCYQIT